MPFASWAAMAAAWVIAMEGGIHFPVSGGEFAAHDLSFLIAVALVGSKNLGGLQSVWVCPMRPNMFQRELR